MKHSKLIAHFQITGDQFTWEYSLSVTNAHIQANKNKDYKSTLKLSILVWRIHVKYVERSIFKQNLLEITQQKFTRAWLFIASIVHIMQEENLSFWSIKPLFTCKEQFWSVKYVTRSFTGNVTWKFTCEFIQVRLHSPAPCVSRNSSISPQGKGVWRRI